MVHLLWSQMRESWSAVGEIPDVKKNRGGHGICTWVCMLPRDMYLGLYVAKREWGHLLEIDQLSYLTNPIASR